MKIDVALYEQKLLGQIIAAPNAYEACGVEVSDKDFLLKKHQYIFRAVQQLRAAGEPVDNVTVYQYLKSKNRLSNAGGGQYIADVVLSFVESVSIGFYAQKIKELACRRRVAKLTDKITSGIMNEDIDEVVEELELAKSELESAKVIKNPSWGELLSNSIERIEARSKLNLDYIDTPVLYPVLQSYTNGWQRGNYYVLAARPSMGKTAMCINMTLKLLQAGYKVRFFSAEMTFDQLITRMIGATTSIDMNKISLGKDLSSSQWQRIWESMAKMSSYNLYADECSQPCPSHVSKVLADDIQSGNHPDLVIIDYINLAVKPEFGNTSEERMRFVSQNYKRIAKEKNVPILALSQLSRAPEGRQDKRPLLTDLRESGSIEQDADVVMFLYNDKYYTRDTNGGKSEGETELIISKHRNGQVGTVYFDFNPNICLFTESESLNKERIDKMTEGRW